MFNINIGVSFANGYNRVIIKVKFIKGSWKQDFVNLLNNYKSLNFCHKRITILHALPKCLLKIAWDVTEITCWKKRFLAGWVH